MPAPLLWTFKITGADEVSRQLIEAAEATRRADSDSVEYAKSLRDQARDANVVIRADEYRSRILVAQHPILRDATQMASMLTSVTRSAVAVQSMWNTAMILTQGTTSDMAAAQDQLASAQAKVFDLLRQGKGDTAEYQQAMEQENSLSQRVIDLKKQESDAWTNNALTVVTSTALIGGQIVQMLPKMIAMASGAVVMGTTYTGALASMSTATSIFGITADTVMAAAPWIALIAAVALVAYYMITHWSDVVNFFNTTLLPAFQAVGKVFSQVGQFIAENWRTLVIVLTSGVGALAVYMIDHWQDIYDGLTAIWNNLKAGFVALWNSFSTIANAGIGGITRGIEGFVNAAVDAINVLIGVYNSAVALVGGRGISLIGHIALAPPQIPLITAAVGFDGVVNKPTMFLAGEAGQSERVTIGNGVNGGGSGGVTINNHFTVQGSIWSEREITDKVLKTLDEKLRDRGFQ